MNTVIEKNWFEDWFNSPYYHILYNQHNFKEAELFIDNLINYLNPEKNSNFLDMGCGKGRHSIYLNKKDFVVTGFDLSPKSIESAKQFENTTLHFFEHDMRKPFSKGGFDFVLNLFTSFGYFQNEADDYSTIEAVSSALKQGGTFVLDFMNVEKIISCMIPQHSITKEGIKFNIHRKVENKFIVKQISFSDKGKNYFFEERVKALTLVDFEKYFSENKLKIIDKRGDFNLNSFSLTTSDRLIVIAKKQYL